MIVEYRVNLTEMDTGREFVYASTATTINLTSLHPNYVYQWRVTAVTIGPGPYTAPHTVSMPEDSK